MRLPVRGAGINAVLKDDIGNDLADADRVIRRAKDDVLYRLGEVDLVGHQVIAFTPNCGLARSATVHATPVAGLVAHTEQ